MYKVYIWIHIWIYVYPIDVFVMCSVYLVGHVQLYIWAHLANVHKLSHILLPALVRVISQHQFFVSLLDDAAARIPRHSQD